MMGLKYDGIVTPHELMMLNHYERLQGVRKRRKTMMMMMMK